MTEFTKKLCRVKMLAKGRATLDTDYEILDIVSYGNTSYIANDNTTLTNFSELENTSKWTALSVVRKQIVGYELAIMYLEDLDLDRSYEMSTQITTYGFLPEASGYFINNEGDTEGKLYGAKGVTTGYEIDPTKSLYIAPTKSWVELSNVGKLTQLQVYNSSDTLLGTYSINDITVSEFNNNSFLKLSDLTDNIIKIQPVVEGTSTVLDTVTINFDNILPYSEL